MSPRTFFACLFAAALAGCATAASPDCTWIPKMTASSADTPATKREVIYFDQALAKNCPAK